VMIHLGLQGVQAEYVLDSSKKAMFQSKGHSKGTRLLGAADCGLQGLKCALG